MSHGFEEDKTKSAQTIEDMISQAVSSAVSNLQSQINSLANKLYPVGSILYTTNNANPSTYLGGTWEAYGMGKVLVGLNTSDSDFNSIGKQGGAKSNSVTPIGSVSGTVGGHTLTVNEMPNHNHGVANASNGFTTFDVNTDHQSTGVGYMLNESGGIYHAGYQASTQDNGGNQAHDHGFSGSFSGQAQNVSTLQPYQVVRIWRRTA